MHRRLDPASASVFAGMGSAADEDVGVPGIGAHAYGYVCREAFTLIRFSPHPGPLPAARGEGDKRVPRRCGNGVLRQSNLQQVLKPGQQGLSLGMQQAEVACAMEALGQHVLQQQLEEGDAIERARAASTGLAVAIAELTLISVAGDQIALAEHVAMELSREVADRLGAVTDPRAVCDPGRGQIDG